MNARVLGIGFVSDKSATKGVRRRESLSGRLWHATANVTFAKQPKFAIVGTGRCGTGFMADLLTEAGLCFSHEGYYTADGPKLRNRNRSYRAVGDVSWLAVPYLPRSGVTVLHQVRHPLSVIQSFYNIGFFDPRFEWKHKPYVLFAKRHFKFSAEPLRSALRWYLEWNSHCEALSNYRFRVEDAHDRLSEIGTRLGANITLTNSTVSTTRNSRSRVVSAAVTDIADALSIFPEYPALVDMASRYGYDLAD